MDRKGLRPYDVKLTASSDKAHRFAISTSGAGAVDVHVDRLKAVLILQEHHIDPLRCYVALFLVGTGTRANGSLMQVLIHSTITCR